jgi:hypothetical protein
VAQDGTERAERAKKTEGQNVAERQDERGFADSICARRYNAEPLVLLKKNIKLLLDDYEPPLVDNKDCEQLLTWKGHLWRMSLEAAMGVQYLHHHRYECSERSERSGRH